MADIDAVARSLEPVSPDVAPPPQADCAGSVLRAYTAAIGQSRAERAAFDAAVAAYFVYHPNAPEPAARLAVARIIASKE